MRSSASREIITGFACWNNFILLMDVCKDVFSPSQAHFFNLLFVVFCFLFGLKNLPLLLAWHETQTNNQTYFLSSVSGINNAITILCAALTDHKILFYSDSYSRLTAACRALIALHYPLKYRYLHHLAFLL